MSTDMLNIQLCILNCIREMGFLVSAEIYTVATLLEQTSSWSWGKVAPRNVHLRPAMRSWYKLRM